MPPTFSPFLEIGSNLSITQITHFLPNHAWKLRRFHARAAAKEGDEEVNFFIAISRPFSWQPRSDVAPKQWRPDMLMVREKSSLFLPFTEVKIEVESQNHLDKFYFTGFEHFFSEIFISAHTFSRLPTIPTASSLYGKGDVKLPYLGIWHMAKQQHNAWLNWHLFSFGVYSKWGLLRFRCVGSTHSLLIRFTRKQKI